MMNNLKAFLAAVLMLQMVVAAAQTSDFPTPTLNTSLIPPSPNAATFAKQGNIPVTLYNGLPSVSVPIFKLTVGSLTLPISLDYNYSGLKPKEDASWVGLGWNLNAGGVITRIVKGSVDGTRSTGNNYEEMNIMDSLTSVGGGGEDQLFLFNVANTNYDGQPDMYSFNFPGHSGKFIYYHNKAYVMPYSKLKITMAPSQVLFTIVDENGVKYLFQDYEVTSPKPKPGDFNVSAYKSSWFLSKIISADNNDTIRFSYTPVTMNEGGTAYSESYQQCNVLASVGAIGTEMSDIYSSYPYGGSDIAGQQLNGIFSRNYNIFFTQGSNRLDMGGSYPTLAGIHITSNFGATLKSIGFTYSYFGNSAYNTQCKLRLDKVSDSAFVPNPENHDYAFTYYAPSGEFPEKGTLGIDYWGYYNSYIDNISLFPTEAFTAKIQGNGIRTPEFDASRIGSLIKIQYPEGGVTEFTYEGNDYSDESSHTNTNGPGIRVKTIKSYDPLNMSNSYVKNFYYADAAGNSTGYLVAVPDFTPHLYDIESSIPAEGGESNYYRIDYLRQFYNYNVDFVTVNGTITNQNLFYTYVKEIDGNNDTTARSDYYYECHCGHQYDYFTGVQLIRQDDFKNTGGGVYVKIKESDYTYQLQLDTLFNAIKPYVRKHLGPYIFLPPSGLTDIYAYDMYNVPVAWSYLSAQTDKLFDDQGNAFTTKKTFNYNTTTRNMVASYTSTSDGRNILKKLKYPEDYTSAITGAMVTANVVSPVIEEQVWLKNSGTDSILIAGKISSYDATLFKPTSEYYFENNTTSVHSLNAETKTGSLYNTLVSDSRYAQRVFYQYGSYGLLQQQNLSGDVVNSFIWGYNNTLPIAAVKNAPANKIAFTSFEDYNVNTGGWTYSGSIITSEGAAGYNSFNGSVSKTVPSGNYVVSAWVKTGTSATVNGGGGTLLITKNNWALYTWSLSSVTSVTVTGTKIDEVRLYPTGAQMSSFTHIPGIGMTTQSDMNNRVSFYEYDDFGRLRVIRDADKNILKLYQYHYRLDHLDAGGGLE